MMLTMHNQSQESLLHGEVFYRSVMENVNDYAFILLDPDACITSWNAGAETILGYQAAEIIGRPASCIFTPEDIENQVPEQEVTMATTAGRAEDERWHLRKDGTRFWASGVLTAFRNESGQLRGFLKIVRDFTERKQAEAERIQLLGQAQVAQQAAEAATRAKDEFIAVIAHELRNPLNTILGWARLVRTRKLDEANLKRAVETIERNAKLQARLIEDLLDLSRIVQGQLRLDICSVLVSNVIEDALETMRPIAAAKHIALEVKLAAMTAEISGDPHRLQQVLCNLLANAIKFTPSGGRVQVCLACSGSEVQIQVSDTGIGIRPEFLPHVFEAFRQEKTASSNSHGLGIGLAITRQLVEVHGGTIQVESQGEGQGATFTLTLPTLPSTDGKPSG